MIKVQKNSQKRLKKHCGWEVRLKELEDQIVYCETCSLTNKITGTDIGVQVKDQKNKAAKALESSYLYQGWDK